MKIKMTEAKCQLKIVIIKHFSIVHYQTQKLACTVIVTNSVTLSQHTGTVVFIPGPLAGEHLLPQSIIPEIHFWSSFLCISEDFNKQYRL